MDYSRDIWAKEKAYLKETLAMIDEQMATSEAKAKFNKDNIVKAQKNMWEERRTQSDPSKEVDGAAIAWQHQSYMDSEARSMTFFARMRDNLERMAVSPYFARIDFDEEGEGEATYYIGMGKLAESDFSHIQVYDWRSPVCSMFYNYDLGEASYHCPAGEIGGKLTLKRQYRIEDRAIAYMFDASVKIDDEVLQEILGKSTDDKMTTIVTSIQKEQNQLIRDEDHQVLMIQGAAGSGKTSIALHRIAYILYRQRNNLHARNMVIFSPNDLFNDYISDVLPELGEENVHRTTFVDYLEKLLGSEGKMEDWNGQMEHILSLGADRGGQRQASVAYKTSGEFVALLRRYVAYLKKEGFGFEDIVFEGTTIITAKALKALYIDHQQVLTPKQSLNRIRLRLHKKLDPLLKEKEKALRKALRWSDEVLLDEEVEERVEVDLRQSFKAVRQQINRLTRMDVRWVYRSLFQYLWLQKKLNGGKAVFTKAQVAYTLRHLDSGYLFYEDALAMAWLKGELDGHPSTEAIKHVVIDEAQDYAPIQYEIFGQLFPKAHFTLLGDVNQSVNPYMGMGRYEAIQSTFGDRRLARVTLKKSYRSSREIAAFCSDLLPYEDRTEYLDRSGSAPIVKDCGDERGMVGDIHDLIEAFCGQGNRSMAIITKTERSAKWLYEQLDSKLGAHLLTRKDTEYQQGIVVVASYLAKGLEFDSVIVCCNGRNNYLVEGERKLFYTVCSRAMHELAVLYTGRKPLFLEG